MYHFEFEALILDAALGKALGKAGAWDRLASWLRVVMEDVVGGMLNPPEKSIAAIAVEILQRARGELQRMGTQVCSESNVERTLCQALGHSKQPLSVAFERWLSHLAVMHCHVHYKPWQLDIALRQLHRFREALPPADLLHAAFRECLVRLTFEQRAVLVLCLYNVGSGLTTRNVTYRDAATILGWGESDQAAQRARKKGKRGLIRIKQIFAQYGYTYTGGVKP